MLWADVSVMFSLLDSIPFLNWNRGPKSARPNGRLNMLNPPECQDTFSTPKINIHANVKFLFMKGNEQKSGLLARRKQQRRSPNSEITGSKNFFKKKVKE